MAESGREQQRGKAGHYKSQTGLTSFEEWIRMEALPSIKRSLCRPCWEGLHTVLGSFNLEIGKRGDGLVLSHREQALFVKASLHRSIDRMLSRASLKNLLGRFEEASYAVREVRFKWNRKRSTYSEIQ